MFSPDVLRALSLHRDSTVRDRTVDITTIGARSGEPRRIEIWFHQVDGRWFLTGSPAKRDWYANLLANPRLVFHLKNGVLADLQATATPITNPGERRGVFEHIVEDLNHPRIPPFMPQPQHVDDWMAGSPLVELAFDDA